MQKNFWANAGFSLMEINMAVFVMAIGILGMVALFPLGLREGIQGRADVKQSMFADHALNQLTALLSDTNLTWSEWSRLDQTAWPQAVTMAGTMSQGPQTWGKANLPNNVRNNLKLTDGWKTGRRALNDNQYRIFFQLTGGKAADNVNRLTPSARVMGIGVRSTDHDVSSYDRYTNNVLYYAEVMFHGDPNK